MSNHPLLYGDIMRILYLGDIVGEKTIEVLKNNLEQIKKDNKIKRWTSFRVTNIDVKDSKPQPWSSPEWI